MIDLVDVSKSYGPGLPAVNHANLHVDKGEFVFVVGSSGSGKSTLIKLLMKELDSTNGTITVSGERLEKMKHRRVAKYRRKLGVVFQDFRLLAFPLGENVAASQDVDAQRARECLARAGLGGRLAAMPEGLETPLYKEAGGVEVSGGEAQKIALARALYKAEAGDPPAPFIVLDEPTAALDPIAEADVYARFNGIVAGKTAVYISHRLSSCRFCDDICVFDGGHLVQRGSHEALLKEENGVYAALWQAQAQYYAEERE